MATLAQLQAESWWLAEKVPASLKALGISLRVYFGLSADSIGTKGNTSHLQGYHRSRNWVKKSAYCTNRTYSVSRTFGDRSGGDSDWVCAMDVTLPRDQLLLVCQRLDKAVRAGKLEKITEWYGNSDGDGRVDGYDNIANRVATSDPSHLWHLHMSFDRGKAGDNHDDLFAILTTDDEEDPLAGITDNDAQALIWRVKTLLDNAETVAGGPKAGEENKLHDALAALDAKLDQVLAALSGGVQVPAVVEVSDASVAKIAKATADELATDPERDGPDT